MVLNDAEPSRISPAITPRDKDRVVATTNQEVGSLDGARHHERQTVVRSLERGARNSRAHQTSGFPNREFVITNFGAVGDK